MCAADYQNKTEYYRNLLEKRDGKSHSGSLDLWNKNSPKWIEEINADGVGKMRTTLRVDAVTSYLREQGLLGPESTVADVGCGPGLFVAEFARTAGQVVGFDFAKTFIDFGTGLVKEAGLTNARFELCDFTQLDVERSGYKEAFDLVFTSITPALSAEGSIDKIIAMSRGYCLNTAHIFVNDNIAKRVASEVFNIGYSPRWRGEGFYALANLIWWLGFYPVTSYYDIEIEDDAVIDNVLAGEIGFLLRRDSGEDIENILSWLKAQSADPDSGAEFDPERNTVKRQISTRYGNVFWDVRRKEERE